MKKRIFILALLSILTFGCEFKTPVAQEATTSTKRPIDYIYEHEGCSYLGLDGHYMIHSETCKNPMHTCDCIDYKLENILELQ